jgi:hypothetical protein
MKIPTGNFGNQIAQPGPRPDVPRGAFMDGTAQGMATAGEKLSGLGAELLGNLSKARTLRTMAESQNALSEAHGQLVQELDAGQIDPVDAEAVWKSRSDKLIAERLKDVGPLSRDVVAAQLQGIGIEFGGRVRQAATRRSQQVIGGDLVALGNELERGSDPEIASARYEQTVRALGPSAGWTPAQIETNTNTFKERVWATKAYSLVNGARNSMQALNAVEQRLNSDEFAALDPQRRAVLLNTASGYKTSLEQRAVAAQQRAEIAAAKREREAGVIFGQVQALATEGKVISPDFIESVTPKMAGTPYEAAFSAAIKQAPEGTSFAMQPLSAQRAILDQIEAKGNADGWTPEMAKRRDALTKSYESSENDYKKDPLRAAVDRGVLDELAPLDIVGGMQSIIQSVGGRMDQARQVEQVTGRPESPFTPEEASQVAGLLSALPPDQKATTMAELSKTVGARTMGAMAAQFDAKDRTLALAAAYGDTRLPGGGLVSERLIRGQQAIADKRVLPADVTEWRAEIAEEVRGTYATPEMEDAVIDAAVLARADAEAGRGSHSISRAIESVSGGIIDFNGGKIPLPMGMTESQFEKGVGALSAHDLEPQAPDGNVYVSGKAIPLSDFVKALPDATLRHAGQGRYTVAAGAGMVLNKAGQLIVVEIGNGTR